MTVSNGTGPSASVMVDEVGIRYAVHGGMRLRTVYTPIFDVRGGAIHPVGVCAVDALHSGGRSFSTHEAAGQSHGRDAAELRKVLDRLHVHNLGNAADLPLELQLRPGLAEDDGAAMAVEIAELAWEAGTAGIDTGRLIFDLTPLAELDAAAFAECARMIRNAGGRLLLDASATSVLGLSPQLRPDVVRLPAAWFRQLSRERAGGKLLATMVAGLRRRGIAVQVEGIDSTTQLRLALEAKVERLVGDLLGEASLAGSTFPEDPQPIAGFLGPASNVVILRST